MCAPLRAFWRQSDYRKVNGGLCPEGSPPGRGQVFSKSTTIHECRPSRFCCPPRWANIVARRRILAARRDAEILHSVHSVGSVLEAVAACS